ncbi:MAG TPA: RNA polymerase sigma factor, partial [Gammaproteobacteria bacterium]|nr:RNA polymerase sigma factor [Gammaproteobacteria bacterium]
MKAARHADFARLIAPHADALFRAAYRLTGNRADAEDLVQDVCVRACANLPTLETLERPKAWLLKIQYRLFVDCARHRGRSPLRATGEDLDASYASADPTLEEITEGSLAERRILAALSRLDTEQRALLALHVEGYTLAELESITDLSTDV